MTFLLFLLSVAVLEAILWKDRAREARHPPASGEESAANSLISLSRAIESEASPPPVPEHQPATLERSESHRLGP